MNSSSSSIQTISADVITTSTSFIEYMKTDNLKLQDWEIKSMLHQSNTVMNNLRKYKLFSDYNIVKTLWKTYAAEKKKMREDMKNVIKRSEQGGGNVSIENGRYSHLGVIYLGLGI